MIKNLKVWISPHGAIMRSYEGATEPWDIGQVPLLEQPYFDMDQLVKDMEKDYPGSVEAWEKRKKSLTSSQIQIYP